MKLASIYRHISATPILLILALATLFLFIAQDLAAAGNKKARNQDEPASSDQVEIPNQPPDSSSGLAIHAERCANCHGDFGRGDGELAAELPNPPAAHGSPEFIRTAVPVELFLTLSNGVIDKGMPPFGPSSSNPLSFDQRWDVIAALFSFGTPVESVDRGQILYLENCAPCHGDDGLGTGAPTAEIEQDPGDITTREYWLNESNQNVFEIVHSSDFSQIHDMELLDDEWWSIIDYSRAFSYDHIDALAALRPLEHATVSGQLSNGTSDEIVTSGPIVTLRGFTPELEIAVTMSGTTDSTGAYSFDLSDVPQDLFYRVTAVYEGLDFSSDFGQVNFGNPELELPITIYEQTTDPRSISIDQLHIILDFSQGLVNISELYLGSNLEDFVFVGESGQIDAGTFLISLPADVQNIAFQRGFGSIDSFVPANEIIPVEGGWADTFPVRPGTGTLYLLAQYSLPYDDEASIDHLINYPASAVNLVIPDAGVSLQNDGEWTDTGQQAMGNNSVSTFGQVALPADTKLAISLEGKPRTAASTSVDLVSDNSTELIVGTALALVVIVIGGLVLRQWRTVPTATSDKEALIQEIALLDEAYDNGEISQEEYQQEREAIKDELRSIWEIEEGEGSSA